MNGKKPPKQRRRAAPKLNSKGEKGSLHQINKIIGKSKNIGAKRVTLLPGFLINGFTSGTVKKARGRPPARKHQTNKDHLLTENLQAFLEQKNHNLRRSQRILQKYNDGHCSKSSGNNSGYEEDIDMREISPMPISCIKSILKKKPKSIFKQISDKFSKVQNGLDNRQEEQEANFRNDPPPLAPEEKQTSNLSTRFEENFASSNHRFAPQYNRDFCENVMKKLRVTFRRNILEECQQNIKDQIAWTNAALAGKAPCKIDESENLDSDNNSEEERCEKLSPIPPKKWVYKTPGKQKPILPPTRQNHRLQPAVMCQQNLFEFNPGCDINSYAAQQNIPVENNAFLRRVAGAKGTPAPFRAPPLNHAVGCNGCFERYRYGQVQKGMVKMPPAKNLNPMCANYHLMQNRSRPPPPPPPLNDFCDQLNDLTFVDTGNNNYQARPSQVAYDTNKRLNEEKEGCRDWNKRPEGTNNLFDFSKSQQDTNNMFNFGVI